MAFPINEPTPLAAVPTTDPIFFFLLKRPNCFLLAFPGLSGRPAPRDGTKRAAAQRSIELERGGTAAMSEEGGAREGGEGSSFDHRKWAGPNRVATGIGGPIKNHATVTAMAGALLGCWPFSTFSADASPSPNPKPSLARLPGTLGRAMDPQQPEPVSYLCGDCGAENTLKPGDVIQCRECGYRILYKKRTRRIVQYEAR
ncbi:hypothetical protein ACP4OV_014300 [Aristida adscensionis]